jgi:alpha-L-arabinofuranosidase
MSRMAGSAVVTSSVENGPTYAVPASAVLSPMGDQAAITSLAALSPDGSTLSVNLVNRSWNTSRRVKISLSGFNAASMTALRISTPGVLDHNGRDIAAVISPWLWKELPLSSGFSGQRELQSEELGPDAEVLLAPHSVITLELRK